MSTLSRKMVNKILEDLTDRRGLRQAWDEIDEEIQEEIRTSWTIIIDNVINEDE